MHGSFTRRAHWPALTWLLALSLSLVPANRAGAVVLVVASDDLPQYREPIEAFEASSSRRVQLIDIDGSRERGEDLLRAAARRNDIEGVFALGGQAAHLSRQLLGSRPLVFALVLDPSPFASMSPEAAVAGISVEMPADALLTRFKLLLPQIRRVGMIHGPETPARLLAEASAASAALGLELVAEKIERSDEVAGAYRRMRTEIDALWMVPDAVVVTRENFAHLVERTRADGIAFLAFSENFVRAGALLSIAPSYATMGSQAAVLLDHVVSSGTGGDLQSPLGSKLVVNADTAKAIGIDLDAATLGMADLVVRDHQSP